MAVLPTGGRRASDKGVRPVIRAPCGRGPHFSRVNSSAKTVADSAMPVHRRRSPGALAGKLPVDTSITEHDFGARPSSAACAGGHAGAPGHRRIRLAHSGDVVPAHSTQRNPKRREVAALQAALRVRFVMGEARELPFETMCARRAVSVAGSVRPAHAAGTIRVSQHRCGGSTATR